MTPGIARRALCAIATLLAVAPFAASCAEDWSAERTKLVAPQDEANANALDKAIAEVGEIRKAQH